MTLQPIADLGRTSLVLNQKSRFFDIGNIINIIQRDDLPVKSTQEMTASALSVVLFIVGVKCDVGGYHYPKPNPPVHLDEPSTPSYQYLPPVIQDLPPLLPDPPLIAPIPTYLPPVATPPDGIFNDDDTIVVQAPPLPPALYTPPTQKMKIASMSCILNSSFKSLMQIDERTSQFPVIEEGVENCIAKASPGVFLMEFHGTKRMAECGIRKCSGDNTGKPSMCVVVRVPTVRGLKLPEDQVVTLRCAPQDTVAAHTKHIRLGPA